MNTDLPGARWFKSSHSESSGACVEVAWLADGMIGIRDSKNATGPALVFPADEWVAFTTGITVGEYDLPS
ncbi:DUF397 domain-containing protein [Nocardia otitidiscaviarum]|uniref:DUF397 domain-containing protein n=1 Tax=Nocardia otitidiscaviarum TaxID=1823 RepID=A0A516NPX2_9NOCA|nr:DUF397 domain-containing protein [Nocardia otitidiscaviarum]MBF6182702.1 DUF397 domain-containing protein [Nocardia otitidiscaviarum]MBF6238889.1 DUF397 domain-containing protein [Nocardia otitidiscaviarum]MCP9623749.1 DUF397 domain-containing protein [Nocardia otitidiscaviarum]QDP80956.1 DUF397 domain-containing protein [Nocardia otitidiscaviarum]